MMTIFETISQMVYIIILSLVYKRTAFSTLIFAMVLRCVLLPYLFLMNTSHNKDRIIETGWKNVIKNLTPFKNNSSSTSNIELSIQTSKQRKRNKKLTRNVAVDKCQKTTQKLPEKHDLSNETDIFTVSTFRRKMDRDEAYDNPNLHTPFNEEPSTSSGLSRPNLHKPVIIRCYSEDESYLPSQEDEHSFTLVQINNMIDSLRDEDLYMKHLRIISEYREDRKRGSKPTLSRYTWLIQEIPHTNSTLPKPKMRGKIKERNLMRMDLLTKLRSSHDNPEEFNILLENLFDIEKQFLRG